MQIILYVKINADDIKHDKRNRYHQVRWLIA